MANGKLQPFVNLNQSKHHCYTLSTTCTLFKLASEVGPRTNIDFLLYYSNFCIYRKYLIIISIVDSEVSNTVLLS